MLFSLTNALAVFMVLMNWIFKPTLDQYAIVFINDILVHSKDHQEHVVPLTKILKTLKWYKLYGNFSKCSFLFDRITFLGHLISGDGISINPLKVEVVINLSKPTNVTKVQSFLCLAIYYRCFIDGFSFIVVPLTRFTRKNVIFFWDSSYEKNFVELKHQLTTASVLILSDNTGQF